MKIINGAGSNCGYCVGHAIIKKSAFEPPARTCIQEPEQEFARFKAAQKICIEQMEKLAAEAEKNIGSESGEIFRAYGSIIEDDDFFDSAFKRLPVERCCIEYLIWDECCKIVDEMKLIDDDYLRERADDISNACKELISQLKGTDNRGHVLAFDDGIIVAEDLTPAETVKMDFSQIKGLVTAQGSLTSHTMILAKAIGIPAVVGVGPVFQSISSSDLLAVDSISGTVTISPDEQAAKGTLEKQKEYQALCDIYNRACIEDAVTLDGYRVKVNINSGDGDSEKSFCAEKCDGVGLFRTEFLYMSKSSYPTEDEQFESYRDIAVKASGKEVIIRTLDIGGDKQADYMGIPHECNPFLGYRAIRLCLDRREVFNTQLRAILRASVYGNIKIMFPMIVTAEELREAKNRVEQAKASLKVEGIAYNDNIEVGIMVETPAAALLSDQLAHEADFFSIGSNDLIQYITATDRMNPNVRYLYDSCNISVLRAIKLTADNARLAGIPWGICGDVAGDERLIPLWVAMGVDELSVVPSLVGKVKHIIRRLNKAKIEAQLDRLLALGSIAELKLHLDELK